MCAATLPTPPRPSRTPPQWCSTSQRYTRRGADKRFSDLKVTLSKSRPQCPFCAHARSHMHVWLHASFLLRNVLWRTGDNVSTREAPRERLQLTGSGRRDIMWTLIRQCRAPPNQTDSYIMAIGNCILLAWRFVSCQCRCKSHHARVRENSLACKAWTRSLSASQ